jgi:hypothetical protein
MNITRAVAAFSVELASLMRTAKQDAGRDVVEAADPFFRPLCRGDERAWRRAMGHIFGSASRIYRCFPPGARSLTEAVALGKKAVRSAVGLLASTVAGTADAFGKISRSEYKKLLTDPAAYSRFMVLIEEAAFVEALRHGRNHAWDAFRHAAHEKPPAGSFLLRFSAPFIDRFHSLIRKEEIAGEGLSVLYRKLTAGDYSGLVTLGELIGVLQGVDRKLKLVELSWSSKHLSLEHAKLCPENAQENALPGAILTQIRETVERCISTLPHPHAEIGRLHFLQEKTAREVAIVLGRYTQAREPQIGLMCWYFSEIKRLVKVQFRRTAPELYAALEVWLQNSDSL